MRRDTPATVTLHELPVTAPTAPATTPTGPALPPHDRVVFVTNAVRRRGGLRSRGEQHRPVLAAVVR